MSVWDDIDVMHKAFKAEMAMAEAAIKELGGHRVKAHDNGIWTCSLKLANGNREVVRAESGAELVKAAKRRRDETKSQ